MRISLLALGSIALAFIFIACHRPAVNAPEDTPEKGTIHISVDESFRPVISDMIATYESLFPGTHIIAQYKPEADCLRDFFNDSATRLVVVARGLNDREDKFMSDSLHFTPGWQKVASDAIAIIVPANSQDTLFSKEKLKAILTGKEPGHQIVFDGKKATSTFRFIKDSVLANEKYDTAVVRAASGSEEVINFVSQNSNAIGLVGISWIGNPEDTAQLNKLRKVKIAYYRCEQCANTPFVKPMQESIATGRYSLVRDICYIIKENYNGLGNGFVSFMKFESGQLLFKRAYLRPVMNFDTRNIKVNVIEKEKK